MILQNDFEIPLILVTKKINKYLDIGIEISRPTPYIFMKNVNKRRNEITSFEIENWEDFQYGRNYLGNNDFKNLLFKDIESDILMIADEGIIMELGFKFNRSSFESFVEYYEKKFSIAFFQPSDYFLFIEDLDLLKIIYKNGQMFYITPKGFSNNLVIPPGLKKIKSSEF